MAPTMVDGHIAAAKEAYASGRLSLGEFEERVGMILDGSWPPPPEPCRCDDPEPVEVTQFGDAAARYLCARCGRAVVVNGHTVR